MFNDVSEINLGKIHIERFCKVFSFRDENGDPLTTFCLNFLFAFYIQFK